MANFDRLTEPQRDCLRRVAAHQQSKTIARALGISKDAVDQRIERAVRTLGASNRTEAALQFVAYEAKTTSHSIPYEPMGVVESAEIPILSPPNGTYGAREERADILREAAAAFAGYVPLDRLETKSADRRRAPNDRSNGQRLAGIMIAALAAMSIVSLLLATMIGFGAVAQRLIH